MERDHVPLADGAAAFHGRLVVPAPGDVENRKLGCSGGKKIFEHQDYRKKGGIQFSSRAASELYSAKI